MNNSIKGQWIPNGWVAPIQPNRCPGCGRCGHCGQPFPAPPQPTWIGYYSPVFTSGNIAPAGPIATGPLDPIL